MLDRPNPLGGQRVEGRPLEEILAFWSEGVDAFRAARQKYLLYR